jgi:hypothetical protein
VETAACVETITSLEGPAEGAELGALIAVRQKTKPPIRVADFGIGFSFLATVFRPEIAREE